MTKDEVLVTPDDVDKVLDVMVLIEDSDLHDLYAAISLAAQQKLQGKYEEKCDDSAHRGYTAKRFVCLDCREEIRQFIEGNHR